MYLEQKNYSKATVKEAQAEQKGNSYPIINGGYPIFNTCNHTTLDMSGLVPHDDDNFMHTLSVKMDDDRYVTLCFMKLGDKQVCIDTKFHSGNTKALSFNEGKSQTMKDIGLLAIVNDIEE